MKLATPASSTPAAELARLHWTIAIVAGATLPHWPLLPFWVPLLLGVAIAWRLAIAALEWPVPIRTLQKGPGPWGRYMKYVAVAYDSMTPSSALTAEVVLP